MTKSNDGGTGVGGDGKASSGCSTSPTPQYAAYESFDDSTLGGCNPVTISVVGTSDNNTDLTQSLPSCNGVSGANPVAHTLTEATSDLVPVTRPSAQVITTIGGDSLAVATTTGTILKTTTSNFLQLPGQVTLFFFFLLYFTS
jgi:hypothetical protein